MKLSPELIREINHHIVSELFEGERVPILFTPATEVIDALTAINKLNPLSFTINRENCGGVRYDVKIYNSYNCIDEVGVSHEILPSAISLAIVKYIKMRKVCDENREVIKKIESLGGTDTYL